ncbi:MAG: NAD(P)H-dependent glycerol-3-phosphate dehydrogenase [Tissierellia bacterium]|nr:NAD(P)H-dependent glycerol-3-phosphate dehydrogenase [Tissierellia bacterium]
MKICFLGGGSWATALAVVLADNKHKTVVYMRNEKDVLLFNEVHENVHYLKGVSLDKSIEFTSDMEYALKDAKMVVLAVGAQNIREILNKANKYIEKDAIILNVSKGIEVDSLKLVSQVVKEFSSNPYGTLSGPTHAEEVSIRIPTAIISSSESLEVAEKVQDIFMNDYFRVYTSMDILGVELGGALKNIIALGTGISDGLKCGDNTKAALMTRGVYEISKMGVKMGADPKTFSGLSGIGDLIVTCTSMHSRNRRAGILIGEGHSLEETLEKIGMLVEGIKTTKSAYDLSKKLGVEMPITEEMYNVLYNGTDIKDTVYNLMLREKKHEMEIVFDVKDEK